MLTIIKHFEFESAHRLPNHPGKGKFTHGHSYKLEIGVSGAVDAKTGMIMNFGTLKEIVKIRIVDRLDHSLLNDLSVLQGFPAECPTAENMVEWIAVQMQQALLSDQCNLTLIRLWETSGSYVEWRP